MSRAKKNPITEMPVIEVDPITDKPGVVETESRPKSNVVPISSGLESAQNGRDWSDVDSVLSNVVSFI